MGSYTPRHLKHEPHRFLSSVGRRGAAVGIGAAVVVPGLVATELSTASTASASSAHVVVLHTGSTGYYVKVVQKRLHIPQTSRFDARTLHAVKNFQRIKHLARDGYVGPQTWRALGGFPGSASTAPKPSASGSRVVSIAERYTGVPYVYGGSTPRGFDCSGFTSYVYRQVGHSLPRTAAAQANATRRVSSPRPGDLVFYGYPAHHVGIYVGGNNMIDSAKPGTRIHVHAIWGAHYFGRV
ncbi:peptidoglycan-binding domain-containing protein [Allobranchiibius sp. GilTou73]|uniref:C40 family peptidase n=1 Tax=Allobranchiibius sp. GilTou73 TaxID=2904523 RepID=UPI001F38129B|nr:peptidoglycan-binding domain-containing protein [Allobranchiibius sp. GilTou73]UIJ35637.1 NlpC/P60 family protein [Allobranchiibius sp. GilTou73]